MTLQTGFFQGLFGVSYDIPDRFAEISEVFHVAEFVNADIKFQYFIMAVYLIGLSQGCKELVGYSLAAKFINIGKDYRKQEFLVPVDEIR